jgi:hypothetical protein
MKNRIVNNEWKARTVKCAGCKPLQVIEANRLIAEACGWKPDGYGHWKHPTRNLSEDVESLPDYCHDLNAMHEAQKVLTEQEQADYAETLFQQECGNDDWMFHVAHATARERAETFLRVKGLWKEKGDK